MTDRSVVSTDQAPDDDLAQEALLLGSEPPSGRFSAVAREAAVAAALPQVVTYFVSGGSLGLTAQGRVGVDDADLDHQRAAVDGVVAALRLRVALVAGARLTGLVQRLQEAPTFRYQRVREEHAGQLRGRLDVPRYLRESGRLTAPRRYPVHVVRRDNATPENVLASYALRWCLRELDAAAQLARPDTRNPEGRDAAALRASLLRLLGVPQIADARQAAERVRSRSSIGALLDRVEARLEAGHIARPEPYAELAAWVRETLSGEPAVRPGSVAGAFYGEDFDPRLFELWCLAEITESLTNVLGPPLQSRTDFRERDREPRVVFQAGIATYEVFFQTSLAVLAGGDTPWSYQHPTRPLQGFPDLSVRVTTDTGTAVVLIDAKLRQRAGAPYDELYKMLGYFSNLPGSIGPRRLGAVVFHDPAGHSPHGTPRRYVLRADEDSVVEAVAVDPVDGSGTATAFAHVASLVLRATGLGDSSEQVLESLQALQTAARHDSDSDTDQASGSEPERRYAAAQAVTTERLLRAADALPAGTLDPTTGHLRAVLGAAAWEGVGPRVERMLVSACHFGSVAPEGTDFSGPVLGLCAGVERLLRETLIDDPLQTAGLSAAGWTLGRLLHHLGDACVEESSPLKPARAAVRDAIATGMGSRGVHRADVASLLPPLHQMRDAFRNQAAHEGLLDRPVWEQAYGAILLTENALLLRMTRVLHPGAVPP